MRKSFDPISFRQYSNLFEGIVFVKSTHETFKTILFEYTVNTYKFSSLDSNLTYTKSSNLYIRVALEILVNLVV